MNMKRREWLQLAGGAVLGSGLRGSDASPWQMDAPEPAAPLRLERKQKGNLWRSTLRNSGTAPVAVKEVRLFSISHGLPADTHLYGEAFQMLSQTAGTLGTPVDIGYPEIKHYRIPQPAGVTALTGMLTLTPPGSETRLLAFTSCRRFSGRFYLMPGRIDVVLDTEGLEIAPGETWDLEEFMTASGERSELLDTLANRIVQNHPPQRFPAPPAGWCSWYCFGPRGHRQPGTRQSRCHRQDRSRASSTFKSTTAISRRWATGWRPGKAFGGDLRQRVEADSHARLRARHLGGALHRRGELDVFREHPAWFIQDAGGKPLRSSDVTFGGWRHGPWYALDGTHPEAQKHLETVFRTMRQEWGCTYFKLDANFWGAMHGGRFHDPKATRIEAYRRGMQAVLRGAGDGFVLGCNHPIWPSFGLIHGSRSSADISRSWKEISETARQNLNRNWQNGRLWWNDPDAVVLTGDLPDDESSNSTPPPSSRRAGWCCPATT